MKQTPLTTTSPLVLWALAAFFGIPGLYDCIEGLRLRMGAEAFLAIGPLSMGIFLGWCALQRRAGRLALSPRGTLIGYICLGLAAGSFLVQAFGTALRVSG